MSRRAEDATSSPHSSPSVVRSPALRGRAFSPDLLWLATVARRELVLLTALIVAALLLRLWALGSVPPYLTSGETEMLGATFRVASSWGPGVFGLDWRHLPALDSYAIALMVALFGNAPVSVRLVSAAVSASAIVPFYLLIRRAVARWPAVGATIIFAASFWYLSLSRIGTDGVWPVVLLVWALWTAHVARERASLRWWAAAGALGGLGLYGPPSGRLVIVVLTLVAIGGVFADRRRKSTDGARRPGRSVRRSLVGLELMLCVAMALFLPQIPASATASGLSGVESVVSSGAAIPWAGGAIFWSTPFDWLDLAPPAVPFLDAITTFFCVIGLAAAWRRNGALAWYAALVACFALGPAAVRETPGATWGAMILPAIAAFTGFGFDAVLTALPAALESALQPLSAVAALAIAALNVWGFGAWNAVPPSGLPIASVLPIASFPAWRADAVQRAGEGASMPPLADWLAQAPPPATPVAPIAAPPTATKEPAPLVRGSPVVKATFARFLAGADTDRWVDPRGIAVGRDGTVYVADPEAHAIHRVDAQGSTLTPLAIDTQPPARPWDVAILEDGALLVDDAEAGVLYRVPEDGSPVRLGALHFGKPRGVAVGADGSILVAETAGNRVVILSPDGRQLGQVTAVQGGVPVLDQPTSVAQLSDGNLLVAEPNAQRLEKLGAGGELLGSWTIPKSDTFNAPHLDVLPGGDAAVTDPVEHQVLVLDSSMRIVGVVGSQGKGDGQMETPTGVATDAQGATLYVVDTPLARVAVFKLAH